MKTTIGETITADKLAIEQSSNGGSPLVVETRGLEKTYFGKVDVHVLHGLDMKIREREFVAIIGQSGSGKSTLLNILGGVGCSDRRNRFDQRDGYFNIG